ncbi:hypothetical protein OKA05_08285 [Luteolibacter arcticus]|uniref:Uncharacterized protein n=1 Tax=Luteolibacter arcticus TaxID=1581411 RepID=A0ABT3GGV0_9BACT|nr:hypothetical protein [Luteolibacter arcticus]MCW1922550.1 hypothetical protein [Luteolibacter arcticus]
MKRTSLILLLAGTIPAILWGQTQNEQGVTEITEAQIINDLPDGAPSEPAPPPAKLVVAPEDVIETKTVEAGERQITIEKIAPLQLPLVPEPAQPPDPLSPEVQQQLLELGETHRETTFVFIGATIFQAADLPGPRTLVRVWDQETQASYSCWSSANWNWLGGVGSFQGEDGRQYALIMSHSSMDVDGWSEFLEEQGTAYDLPTVPELPAGEASFVVSEGAPAAEALSPVVALHQLYNKDGERLKAAYEGRQRAQQEREEFLRANPPRPKGIVIRHWRMDEAGQQGITPKPAVAR